MKRGKVCPFPLQEKYPQAEAQGYLTITQTAIHQVLIADTEHLFFY
jgi:hypothetical protein